MSMTAGQESAYTSGMSWKDFLNTDELAELADLEAEKQAAAERYNAKWRILKSRGDARMRRAKSKSLESNNRSNNNDGD